VQAAKASFRLVILCLGRGGRDAPDRWVLGLNNATRAMMKVSIVEEQRHDRRNGASSNGVKLGLALARSRQTLAGDRDGRNTGWRERERELRRDRGG
jgi:hypothetical protein